MTGHTSPVTANTNLPVPGKATAWTLADFHRERGHTVGCRLRRRPNALNIQLSKNELQAAYPWGLGWSSSKT